MQEINFTIRSWSKINSSVGLLIEMTMVDLVVWVLEAEMAVLTEEEAVVFRGSWGLSCHGGAGRTLREVGALLRRILSGLRVDQGRRRRRKGSKSNPTPTLPQTNRSLNLLEGS